MTPEELIDEILNELDAFILVPWELTISYNKKKIEILDGIKQAKSEWCKEQRKFCAQACYGEITDMQWRSIENAPEPQ